MTPKLVVTCPRARGAHVLARRTVTPTGPEVVAATSVLTTKGYAIHRRTYTATDLVHDWDGDTAPLEQLAVTVGCRCGRYTVDVAALLRGDQVTARRHPITAADEREHGISPDRMR